MSSSASFLLLLGENVLIILSIHFLFVSSNCLCKLPKSGIKLWEWHLNNYFNFFNLWRNLQILEIQLPTLTYKLVLPRTAWSSRLRSIESLYFEPNLIKHLFLIFYEMVIRHTLEPFFPPKKFMHQWVRKLILTLQIFRIWDAKSCATRTNSFI